MYDAILAYLDDPHSFPVPKSPYRNKDGSLTAKAQRRRKADLTVKGTVSAVMEENILQIVQKQWTIKEY